jgi:hypothetical protein
MWRVARCVVSQIGILAERMGDVDAKAVNPPVEPEAEHVVHRLRDLWVIPVEVGLLGKERVQV